MHKFLSVADNSYCPSWISKGRMTIKISSSIYMKVMWPSLGFNSGPLICDQTGYQLQMSTTTLILFFMKKTKSLVKLGLKIKASARAMNWITLWVKTKHKGVCIYITTCISHTMDLTLRWTYKLEFSTSPSTCISLFVTTSCEGNKQHVHTTPDRRQSQKIFLFLHKKHVEVLIRHNIYFLFKWKFFLRLHDFNFSSRHAQEDCK